MVNVTDILAFSFTTLCIIVFTDIIGTIDLYIDKFGIDPRVSGAFIGATPLMAAVSGIPIVYLSRKWTIKSIILLCASCGFAFSFIYAFGYLADSVAPVLISRILLGLFVTSPQLSGMYMHQTYHGEALAEAASLFSAFTCLGYALGPLIGASLIYIFAPSRNLVVNEKTANAWFDIFLCLTYCVVTFYYFNVPKKAVRSKEARESLRTDLPSYGVNLAITFLQAVAYALWYVHSAALIPWLDWNVQSRLLYASGLVFFTIPFQLVTRWRFPPFRSILLWSVLAFGGSILLIPFSSIDATNLALYTLGSVIFSPSSMIVHAISFTICGPLAVRPKDVGSSVVFITYMIGVSTGSVVVFFMDSFSIGMTVCACNLANVVLSVVLSLTYFRKARLTLSTTKGDNLRMVIHAP